MLRERSFSSGQPLGFGIQLRFEGQGLVVGETILDSQENSSVIASRYSLWVCPGLPLNPAYHLLNGLHLPPQHELQAQEESLSELSRLLSVA
jgi:hypothetical protein